MLINKLTLSWPRVYPLKRKNNGLIKKMKKKAIQTTLALALLVAGGFLRVQQTYAAGWENVGAVGFSAGDDVEYTSLAFNSSTNEPYVVYQDNANSGKATVKKFSNDSWRSVGPAGFNTGTGTGDDALYTSIAFNPSTNEPYVAFVDEGHYSKVTVMRFHSGSWQLVGSAGFSAGNSHYLSFAFNPSTSEPYVAYKDDANSSKATVMKFSGGSWQNVGSAGFSAGKATFTALAFNPSTNEPYVAYADGANSTEVSVMKFSGGSWQVVGDAGFGGWAEGVSLAFNPSTSEPYVVYLGHWNLSQATVMKFSGGSWQTVGVTGFTATHVKAMSLSFNPSTSEPYFAYADSNHSYKATVMKFHNGYWQVVGSAGFSAGYIFSSSGEAGGKAYTSSLAFKPSTNELYITYKDDGARVMKFDGQVRVTTDTPTLNYSISKKAKKRISYTFTNLSLTNKKYVKMTLSGRRLKVISVRRSDTDSIVTIELKYAKWGTGNYNLAMSYKNKVKIPYEKRGKIKFRKGWESGSVSSENILSII
jgi:hypothetical protein